MLREQEPDIFCFVTHPDIRESFVRLGAESGVKGIMMEKPMATSLAEARRMTAMCTERGIKAVVCHQQKYIPAMQKLKQIVDSGELGSIEKIFVDTHPWLSQLGTHFMDYALWAAGCDRAKWVVGHAHGSGKLQDNHPSPDFVSGIVCLENGVHVVLEMGYLSRKYQPADQFWTDNRLTVYGTHGSAYAETDGAWGYVTTASGRLTGNAGTWDEVQPDLQKPFAADFIRWMDDDAMVSPCGIQTACNGFEMLEGILTSALTLRRIDIPMADEDIHEDILDRLAKVL